MAYTGLNLAKPEGLVSRVAGTYVARTTIDCQNAVTKGADYNGQTNITVDNKVCQAWADIPADHDHYDALGADLNFCR